MNQRTLKLLLVLSTFLGIHHCFTEKVQAQSLSQQSCEAIGTNPINDRALNERKNRAGAWKNGSKEVSFERYFIDVAYPRPTRNTTRFRSPAREENTNGRFVNVVPDGISGSYYPYKFRVRRGGLSFTLVAPIYIGNSVFWEAKTGVTELDETGGSGTQPSYQMLGFLDALSIEFARNRVIAEDLYSQIPFATLRGPDTKLVPKLVFGMSSSSRLARSYYRNRANDYGIAVFRAVPCDFEALGGELGQNDMVMGSGILLNPSVFRDSEYRANINPGLPGTTVKRTSSPPNPPGGGS